MEAQYQDDNVLILADDFTGANDAAVSFALNGAQAMVMFHPENVPQAQVVAVNTDSRALPASQAEQAIKAAIHSVALPGGLGWRVKKWTLRCGVTPALNCLRQYRNSV
ncbi:four-carbon acid sugar kinase family protein [Mangrovibacter sp. SLW1]